MAIETAESPQFDPFTPPEMSGDQLSLYAVWGSDQSIETDIEQPGGLIDIDTIPELEFVRLRARQEADKLLEENRQLLYEGQSESVPLPVDPLGTAKFVVEIGKTYGIDSPNYQEGFAGLALDCERLIGEATRKTTWEKFNKTSHLFDPETERYLSHGIPVLDITKRGLSPMAEPEEVDRRVNDYVAEYANHYIPKIKSLGHLALQKTVTVRGVSECTDWAIEAHKFNPKAAVGGYVPEIKKLMVVDVIFDESNNRQQEQVALPGIYITHKVITSVMQKQGAIAEGQSLTKTELHSKHFIDQSNLGIMGFVALLDAEASRTSSKNIYMGEVVPDDYDKDYDRSSEEAEERRRKLIPMPVQLAEYLITLQNNDTDRGVAEELVNKFLRNMLIDVAKKNPDQAVIIFDQATAQGLGEVTRLEKLGLFDQAIELQTSVELNAPAISYCGAGVCGLEFVSEFSAEAMIAKSLGLGTGLSRDTIRTCANRECGATSVHYDLKGNKACTKCGYRKINGVLSKGRVDRESKWNILEAA